MSKSRSSKKEKRIQMKSSPRISDALIDSGQQAKRLEWVFMGVLLAAGVYLSIVYFGQKAVPNSDFTAFVRTGQQVLRFQMPSSFKRVPVLGILQVAFGKLMVSSPHPNLTGALVLNGALYTLSILRFFCDADAVSDTQTLPLVLSGGDAGLNDALRMLRPDRHRAAV
jgi:hypothetical protein